MFLTRFRLFIDVQMPRERVELCTLLTHMRVSAGLASTIRSRKGSRSRIFFKTPRSNTSKFEGGVT